MKEELLQWIERDREKIVAFIQGFVRAASPNPPGDTLHAMARVRALLDEAGIAYDLRVKDPIMPNLVASSTFAPGGKHLVLNGHIDVFPVENPSAWASDPWAAEIRDESIYGRGVADMKVGTAASILTYLYLQRLNEKLQGKLTLTVVSDEETLGPNGANHLFDQYEDEFTGTSCLNGEPSSQHTIRFGEKGSAWLHFTIETPGGHAAYPHLSPNAIDLAYKLIADLRSFTQFKFEEPAEYTAIMDASQAAFDRANGAGASKLARSILMNVGTIVGGAKVNMIASRCDVDIDFRLPNGVTRHDLLAHIDSLKARHDFTYTITKINDANWCAPKSELAQLVRANARRITGIEPTDVIGMANTDARLWRYRGVPAVVYGPSPLGMGSTDECVPIDEALNVIRVHVLSAYEYLAAPQ